MAKKKFCTRYNMYEGFINYVNLGRKLSQKY